MSTSLHPLHPPPLPSPTPYTLHAQSGLPLHNRPSAPPPTHTAHTHSAAKKAAEEKYPLAEYSEAMKALPDEADVAEGLRVAKQTKLDGMVSTDPSVVRSVWGGHGVHRPQRGAQRLGGGAWCPQTPAWCAVCVGGHAHVCVPMHTVCACACLCVCYYQPSALLQHLCMCGVWPCLCGVCF